MALRKYIPLSIRNVPKDPDAKPLMAHVDLFHIDPLEHIHFAMMKPMAHHGLIVVAAAKSALSQVLLQAPVEHEMPAKSYIISHMHADLTEEILKILREKNIEIVTDLSHVDFHRENTEPQLPLLFQNLNNIRSDHADYYEKKIILEDKEEKDRRKQYKLRNKHYRGKMNSPRK